MKELEAPLFDWSITFINKQNSVLVVDEELIASRAKNKKRKPLSNIKPGKE